MSKFVIWATKENLYHGKAPQFECIDVANYPGFADVIQGPWLMEQMQKQAEQVGTRIVFDDVSKVELASRPFRLACDSGEVYLADSLIIATGALARSAVGAEVPWLRRVGLCDL